MSQFFTFHTTVAMRVFSRCPVLTCRHRLSHPCVPLFLHRPRPPPFRPRPNPPPPLSAQHLEWRHAAAPRLAASPSAGARPRPLPATAAPAPPPRARQRTPRWAARGNTRRRGGTAPPRVWAQGATRARGERTQHATAARLHPSGRDAALRTRGPPWLVSRMCIKHTQRR